MGAVSAVVETVSDVVEDVGSTIEDVVVKPVTDVVGDVYMEVRDPLEAAAVVAGNYLLPGSSLVTSQLVSDAAKEKLATDEFQLANIAAGIAGGVQGNTSNYGKIGESLGGTTTDPNAVGGVTGPDNIDVGGGFNPSEELTAQQVLDKIAADQAASASEMTAAEAQAIIDAEAAEAAKAGLTPAEAAAAKAAGISYLDYAKAGLLANAVAGDPLGLGGDKPEQTPAGSTGFNIVPIPAEWKSPTYAISSAPIDLESIFSNQNMLGGTQWQNLPRQQPNVSFNDIFAAGQQQTPTGTPVDINQIVSAILGQTTTS